MTERFLVVKLADLGDALTATPALRALRDTFPTAQIDALVTASGAAALRGLDSVDNLIVFDKAQFDRPRPMPRAVAAALRLAARLRAGNYQRVFLLHHLFTAAGRLKYRALLAATGAPWRGGLAEGSPSYLSAVAPDSGYGVRHEADYWLDVVGLAGARPASLPRLELVIDDGARAAAAELLNQGGQSSRYRIALFPGSGAYSLGRRWPAERFVEVGQRLGAIFGGRQANGALDVLVVGGAAEHDLAAQVCRGIGPIARNLAGQTELKTLAALLGRCDLFIGNDGGVMHVAATTGIPMVTIFGPTNHVSWGPYGGVAWSGALPATSRSIVFWQDLPCAPCLYRGFLPGTPRGCLAHDCLRRTTAAEVVRAATLLLSERQK